jgi:membrane complex biogenesis BtpA family protein
MALADTIRSLHRPLVIGMLHVPALPGAPNCDTDLRTITARVLEDARKLIGGGIDGLMLENFGDIPFFPTRAPHETVAYLTMLACTVKAKHPTVTLGINVLRNDGLSALAVAHAANADFIRVNVLCGARVTDQGVLQGIAHDILRLRKTLNAGPIEIMADVDVKHSAPLGVPRPIEVEVEDLTHRALANALIVSGTGTGKATDPQKLLAVKNAADVPVFVGSGVTAESAAALGGADGFIVGTSLKQDNSGPAGPVDEGKVRRFIEAVQRLKR